MDIYAIAYIYEYIIYIWCRIIVFLRFDISFVYYCGAYFLEIFVRSHPNKYYTHITCTHTKNLSSICSVAKLE